MITENLSTLKINKLTQEQYNREFEAGRIDPDAIYLTPDEDEYTKDEIDTKLELKANVDHNHDSNYDTLGSANTALAAAKEYTDEKFNIIPSVDAYTKSEIDTAFDEINDSIDNKLLTKANTSHNHDDVYYTEIEIDTKIEEVNTSISNIIDGTTMVSKAANAGKATHANDANSAEAARRDFNNNVITEHYETKDDASSKLTEAKTYTDTKTANLASTTVVDNKITSHNTSTSAHDDIRGLISDLTTRLNALANSDDTTLDQMSEVVAYIKNNKSLIDGITTSKVNVSDIVNNLTNNSTNKPLSAAQGVAIKALIDALDEELDSHTHAIADVSGLQSALDGKVSKTEFDTHVSDTTKHIASTERTNWNTAYNHSQAAHAPSNAQANQNAFSNIAVSGQTTVAADTTTDTVTFDGINVSITTDATNDKVTFSVADASTSDKGVVKLSDSTSDWSSTTAATSYSVAMAYNYADLANKYAAEVDTKAMDAYSLAESKVGSLSDLGITATSTELNYCDGVTSNIQTQINNKANSSHGNHVPTTQTVNNAVFLRNDNTWATVTPANIGAATSGHSHDDIYMTKANPTGTGSLSLNRKASTTVAEYSVAEGYNNTATGRASHAEGEGTTASSQAAHAEGYGTTASNYYAHAEGNATTASNRAAHAEGTSTVAKGQQSHAEGFQTIAASTNQHVQGKYNIEDANDTYAHIVGNGSSDARSNAHTVDWNGNAWFKGNIYLGGTSQDNATIKGIIVHNSTTSLPAVTNGAILIAYDA